MSIILKDAMNVGGLKNCRLLTGEEGLFNSIDNVTIMEVPDITRWLKGNELLLTSLLTKNDLLDLRKFIQQLSTINIAALAIKPYHYLGEVPPELLEESKRHGIPIIEIPEQVSYLDILTPVMGAIFNKNMLLQNDIEQANKTLREISINGGGIGYFIETLESLIQKNVTIESELPFIKLPQANDEITPIDKEKMQTLEQIKHPIQLERRRRGENVSCIVAPVLVDGMMFGYITSWGSKTEDIQLESSILEQASIFLSLEFLRFKIKDDIEQQYKNEFIRELLFNESMRFADLIEKGEKYGFINERRYTCILLTTKYLHNKDENEKVTKVNKATHLIQEEYPFSIVGSIREYICVIFPVGEQTDEEIKAQCQKISNDLDAYVEHHFVSFMGIGRAYAGIKGLRESFIQAETALKLGSKLKKHQVITFYENLGIYRLLGELADGKELNDFYGETIGKIIEYDELRSLNLVNTLEIYFENNENLKETAACLYIHVNTLKYRIGKITSITGYSLTDIHGKMMLYLGMKIRELSL